MEKPIQNIRWYFNNVRQIWGLMCVLLAIGLILYNVYKETLTAERIVLILFLIMGIWWVLRFVLKSTEKEVEKEIITAFEEYDEEKMKRVFFDVFDRFPISQMLVRVNHDFCIERVNTFMAKILGKDPAMFTEVSLADLNIKAFYPDEEIIQNLLKEGKLIGEKIVVFQKTYFLWASIIKIQNESYAYFLLFEPTLSNEQTFLFNNIDLTNFFHDIFDTMNAIIGFTSLLQENQISIDKKKQYFQIVQYNAKKMQHLITNIVEFSYYDTTVYKKTNSLENLNFLVDEIMMHINRETPLVTNTLRINIEKSMSDEECFIFTDKSTIQKLFIHLFFYLHDYFPFSRINIKTGINSNNNNIFFDIHLYFQQYMYIKIANFCEQLAGIYQVQKSNSKNEFSIYWIHKLISLMDGNISCRMIGEDSLSIFLEIPVHITSNFNSDNNGLLHIPDNTLLKDKIILVVEDIEYNRMLLEEFLSDIGSTVYYASSGNEAIEYCNSLTTLDVVLLDIQLPDINGYEVMKIIKTKFPEAVIIAQTAYTLAADKNKAMNEGFHYYLTKPLKRNSLLNILANLIQKHLN